MGGSANIPSDTEGRTKCRRRPQEGVHDSMRNFGFWFRPECQKATIRSQRTTAKGAVGWLFWRYGPNNETTVQSVNTLFSEILELGARSSSSVF